MKNIRLKPVLSILQMEFPNRSVKVDFSAMLNSREFSQQLCYLNGNELSDEIQGAYVSQWLVPMLSKHDDTVMRQTEFPIISKKMRDDVIGTKVPPFRRSGYWSFLKVMLQFNLTIEFGKINGKIVYKLVLLKCMAILCNYYDTKMYSTLKVDVVQHMLAKLARRIEKIDNLLSALDEEHPNRFDALPNGFEDIYKNTIDEVKLVIFKVKLKLDRQIAHLQHNDEMTSTLIPLSQLDFEADVHQKLPNLRKYLQTRQTPPQQSENRKKLKVKFYSRHLIDSVEAAPDVNCFDKLKTPIEVGIFLYDFENWILYALNDICACTPDTLRSLSFAYGRLAARHYKDDPLGFSRTVLAQMKILKLLDKIAIEAHKMLKKHRAGINCEVFDNLLLPQNEDFEIAHDLKKYFTERSKAEYPSLLEQENLSTDSFAQRFAKESKEMEEIIERIQHSADATVAKLKLEWEKRRKEVSVLKNKLEAMECEYVFNSDGKRQHKDPCRYCKLNTKIQNVRVTTFELPWPDDDDNRNAIVFELRIPIEIACLRDVLYEMMKLLNEPAKKIRVYDKWIESDELDEFNESTSERVFLGTTVRGKTGGRTRTRGMYEFLF